MLLITPQDNVGVVLEDVNKGDICVFENVSVEAKEDIAFPHKIALIDMPPETLIVKYGETIGHALTYIPRGSLVHSHNMGCRRGSVNKEGLV